MRKESEMGFCVVVVPFVLLVEILLSFSNDCNARTVLVFCICRDGLQSVLFPRCPCCMYFGSNIHDSCSFHDMFSAALIATFRFGAVNTIAAAAAVVHFLFRTSIGIIDTVTTQQISSNNDSAMTTTRFRI